MALLKALCWALIFIIRILCISMKISISLSDISDTEFDRDRAFAQRENY